MASYPHCAVRVKVKKCELNLPCEWRKFSVDPQITSLEVLYSLLAKAFDIKSDFSIKYKAFDPAGNEIYLSVLSDWDLDAAFLRIHNLAIQTATEPCLMLQIDIKPFTEVREWDIDATATTSTVANNSGGSGSTSVNALSPSFSVNTGVREAVSPLQQSIGASQKYVQNMQTKLPGLIMNHMEKTFSIVQKAFNLSEETMASLPPRPPLADNEFRLFLDALGQIKRNDELRKVIFLGGIDPSLRRVVWKHILNVYPHGMNGHQRMDYMRRKAEQYIKLRDTWINAVKQGCIAGELSYVTSMVKKDVLRTDRLHPFYAGSDDNQNIASLFNILTTYALNHPSVSYCQGMSDIASPLLVTMNDEAQAYICFCAIMTRVKGNFMLDGIAMTQKFTHLTEALSFYDPEFWEYLKSQQADDLLYCYRWLLLELKREFPFDDALRMLEVQWSALKYETSICKELNLFEKEFVPISESPAPTSSSSQSSSYGAPISPSYLLVKSRENPYTKVCALRRQSSSASLNSLSSSLSAGGGVLSSLRLDATKRLNQSLDDNMPRAVACRRRHSSKAHQSLDESKMLLLMEGMEDVKNGEANNLTSKSRDEECAAFVEDDDVFASSESSANKDSNDIEHFIFHPTNPFLEDGITKEEIVKVTSQSPKHANVATLNESDADESFGENGIMAKIPQLPKGIAKLQNKNILSNYNTVSNIIAKQIANASNVGDSVRRVSSGGGGHFRDLKEKIAATSRKGISFDELSNTEKSQQKLVKNFNEFLNFASMNKNRIADKFAATPPTVTGNNDASLNAYSKDKSKTPSPTHAYKSTTAQTTPHPLVQLTRSAFVSSLDESDSSSVPDTTWSGSTAATAIQQTNNASNNSLHMELASLGSSTAHTPDRTPTYERKTDGAELAEACEASVSTLADVKHTPTKNLPAEPSLTPDDSQDQDYYPMTTAITRELRLEADNLDRQVFGEPVEKQPPVNCEFEYEKLDRDSLDLVEDLKENEIVACPDISELLIRRRSRNSRSRSSIEPLQHVTTSSILPSTAGCYML
uniref:TBC1 domain family member 25 n=1 Tax=Bactrocera dorsalis TaxID=27457 RepID=A0A034VDI6_BACDO